MFSRRLRPIEYASLSPRSVSLKNRFPAESVVYASPPLSPTSTFPVDVTPVDEMVPNVALPFWAIRVVPLIRKLLSTFTLPLP